MFKILSLITGTLLFAGTITLNEGWNLKGTSENIDVNKTFSKNSVEAVWGYKNSKWECFFPNSKGDYSKFKKLTSIQKGDGFWVLANEKTTIETDKNSIDLTAIKGKIPDKTLSIKEVETNETLRAYLWLPNNYTPNKKYPAVVMAHGCGGAHYKDDPKYWNAQYVAGKYKFWGALLNREGFIVLLVDSFTTRDNNDVGKGVCNTSNPLDRPSKIDPVSIRPADIASGIAYLKSRSDVDKNRVGVLGFSNGATSALVFANHTNLLKREEELIAEGKKFFDLPLEDKYKADVIIALYPGCGLNGYSPETQNIFKDNFEVDTPTYLFMASNDHILPADTKSKCTNLENLNNNSLFHLEEVPNTDHQFDYYERDEKPVQEVIYKILNIFETM